MQPDNDKSAVDEYDSKHGKYEGNVDKVRGGDAGNLLPVDAMPKAPDPSPFKIGGQ